MAVNVEMEEHEWQSLYKWLQPLKNPDEEVVELTRPTGNQLLAAKRLMKQLSQVHIDPNSGETNNPTEQEDNARGLVSGAGNPGGGERLGQAKEINDPAFADNGVDKQV